jgi:proline iminopeptidase
MSLRFVELPREGSLTVPGAQLYLRDVGTGTTLIVLHGGPDFNHNYLLPEMDTLAGNFRLIYYDQRGRGKSSGEVAPDEVTIESEVEDLDCVRRHFGLDAVALLGHSWGCLLAMEYATCHPDRTSGLILMNPAPASHVDLMRFRQQREVEEAENLSTMRRLAATEGFAQGDIEAEARYYRAHFGSTVKRPQDLDGVVARLRSHFTPHDILKARAIEERLYDQTWRKPEYNVLDRLARRPPRTLVISGDGDFIPRDCAMSIVDAIPGAQLALLENCGHFAYLERLEEVMNIINGFCTKC